jgi:hypothetical protein
VNNQSISCGYKISVTFPQILNFTKTQNKVKIQNGTSLEPELAVSVCEPAPIFKLKEGFVTHKFFSDSRRGRDFKMTQTRQMLEEVYLFFDELSSIIIHKDMRQSLPKSVPQPDRVITGSHRGGD